MDNFVHQYSKQKRFSEAKSSAEDNYHLDAILKFVSQMLMEEEDTPSTVHDCLALKATEKSLYDVLMNNNLDEYSNTPDDRFANACSGSSLDTSCLVGSNWMGDFESLIVHRAAYRQQVSHKSTAAFTFGYDSEQINGKAAGYMDLVDQSTRDHWRKMINRNREASGFIDEDRSNNQLANNVGETGPVEMNDNVVLHDNQMKTQAMKNSLQDEQFESRSYKGRRRGRKIQIIIKDAIDLTSLLMQCAQAVSCFDNRAVEVMLLQLRQHSSHLGDSTERLAYYLANALQARLAGTGTPPSAAFNSKGMLATHSFKVYRMFNTASPFANMSYFLANKTIMNLATEATTLHIIDFSILLGYQWPSLIEALSERLGGPPKLRITRIDFPGTHLATTNNGHTLANHCMRFGVPFEYNGIEQQWDTIRLEDLKIGKNELLVVNCLYGLHHVLDEAIEVNSPRDEVLHLIKKINPDMFIHGVINGTYNTPFFFERFKEAFYYFSSTFNMLEATMPREDEGRLLFEEHLIGRNAINVIACEGSERFERPETYKNWQVRHVRAGFKQLPLDQEIVNHVRSKVKSGYHKHFMVEEDGKWMLLGWKGRVNRAISCWQPAHHSSIRGQ